MLELVEWEIPVPGNGEVLIEVEACGICGAGAGDVNGADPVLKPPRIPRHEVVGRIAQIGAGVASMWKTGQRVDVGRLGGHCNECTNAGNKTFVSARGTNPLARIATVDTWK
jgi:alcohol dehydrogenase